MNFASRNLLRMEPGDKGITYQGKIAEYFIDRPTRKISHMQLVPEDRPLHVGSSRTFREDVIDLSVTRQYADYDKLGCKNMLSSVKFYLLGSKSVRMTKERVGEFFGDPDNFKIDSEFLQWMNSMWR